jgi:hypothetical protein
VHLGVSDGRILVNGKSDGARAVCSGNLHDQPMAIWRDAGKSGNRLIENLLQSCSVVTDFINKSGVPFETAEENFTVRSKQRMVALRVGNLSRVGKLFQQVQELEPPR